MTTLTQTGDYNLKFTTALATARNPTETRTAYATILSAQGLQALIDTLQQKDAP